MRKNTVNTINRWRSRVAAVVMSTVLIMPASVSGLADSTRGYQIHRDIVEAKSYDVYTVVFRGREVARIAVKGDGDTDLDLYIFDADGNLVVSDEDYSDTCAVSWTPPWTGRFTIKVVNRGNVYNEYMIATN